MSLHLQAAVQLARLALPGASPTWMPLLQPSVVGIGGDLKAFTSDYRHAIETIPCELGEYFGLSKILSPLRLTRRRIAVTFLADKRGRRHGALEVSFEAFVAPVKSGGFIGFIPEIGMEALAEKEDEIEERLKEAVRLEFRMSGRPGNPAAILETQWFEPVEVSEVSVEVPLYSPQELKEIAERGRQRVLEMVATLKKDGETAYGLDRAVAEMAEALQGKLARSVLLVGSPGCGKSAAVSELVRRKAVLGLGDRAIWEATAARMVQKLTGRSGWEDGLGRLIKELREEHGLLYVPNLADLFEVGQYVGHEVSIADFLKTFIERGELRLITEVTPEQAARLDVRAPGYLSLFHRIEMAEARGKDLEEIVALRACAFGGARGVKVEDDAVVEAVRLHLKYALYSGYPGRAIRFLEALILSLRGTEQNVVTRGVVVKRFCEESGMPSFVVDPDAPMPLALLEEHFRTSIHGQDEAVEAVIQLLAAVKAGLTGGGKPIATLLFAGPTGVGKTEMAKALAEFLFSSRARTVRFDMSEFSDPAAGLRLTGDDGRGEGLLTGAVRQDPFSVVLLDEIEKADASVFDLLLQVLGEGRLTDAHGRVADFCSTVIIMTSNVGASSLPQSSLGFGGVRDDSARVRDHFRAEAERFFRPEFINRLDRVVAFSPLSREAMRRIVDREVAKVRRRPGLMHRDVRLSLPVEVLDALCVRGYDARYGARQLQRTIRDDIAVPLARKMNAYEERSPLSAESVVAGGAIRVTVKGGLEAGAAFAARKGAHAQAAARLTGLRRTAQALIDGPGMSRLRSEIQIAARGLDTKSLAKPMKLSEGARVADMREIESGCVEAEELIALAETQAVIPMLGGTAAGTVNDDQGYAEGDKALLAAARRLYAHLNSANAEGILAIYGTEEPVRRVVSWYFEAVRELGLQSEARWVWMQPRNRTFLLERPTAADALFVGAEIVICGDVTFLAFSGENGLIRLEDTAPPLEAVAMFEQGTRENCEPRRPQDVHRKSFFRGKPALYTAQAGRFVDHRRKPGLAGKDPARAVSEALFFEMKTRLFAELAR